MTSSAGHAPAKGGALTSDGSALGPRHALVRETVMSFALRRCRAPSVVELVDAIGISGTTEEDVRKTLSELQDAHAVVLHPGGEIYMAHPFAFYPTLFQVSFTQHDGPTPKRGCFDSPCIWCALGAAAALENAGLGDSCITTCDGGDCSRPVQLNIRSGSIEPTKSAEGGDEWLVHFLVPARDAWENVAYTCSNMLLFSSRRRIEEWRERNGVKPGEGDIKTLKQTAEMARGW